MDRITSSLIRQFSDDYELHLSNDTVLFEYFCNFCAATNENGLDDIELEEFTTGISAQGIDGIAIIVNNRFVYSIDDINEMIRLNKTIKVKFVLVQSKTSDKFDNTEMLNFFHYAKKFFSEDNHIFSTVEMTRFIELKNYIFDNASKLEKNPELLLYYCTTGVWNNDETLLNIIKETKKELLSTNLFSNVNFKICGAEEIQNLYRKTFSELTATFKFEKKVVMYSLSEDEIGYCGVLPFKEFSKIILDEEGMLKPVFEDNIRDFLGTNTDVNKSIEDTIASGDNNSFSQLNNGIMIVTSFSNLSGDIMNIKDYQIVNGCQTSHMLYEHKNDGQNIDELMIPVRIISTRNEDLKNKITKATNNQTAMFLDNPHGVSGQYGTIAKNVGNRLFKNSDKSIIYYTSALALYRIESLLKSGIIDKKYWRIRYHALMLLRVVISGEEMPKFNAKKMEAYCQKILDVLNSEDLCLKYFSAIVQYIVEKTNLDIQNRKTFERKESTDYLIGKSNEIRQYVSEKIK